MSPPLSFVSTNPIRDIKVSERLLFNAKWVNCQLYHHKNNLHLMKWWGCLLFTRPTPLIGSLVPCTEITVRFTWRHKPVFEPTWLSMWFDLNTAQTVDLQHSRRARQELHSLCGYDNCITNKTNHKLLQHYNF